MKKRTVLVAGLASAIALTGCVKGGSCCSEAKPMPVHQAAPVVVHAQPVVTPVQAPLPAAPVVKKAPELMKISGIGYGAESTYGAYTPGQRRLMAIRSSKLDAYRALAEQLYGVKIDSNTSVSTLTAKNDSFRAS